ncbi:MAG: hypothetical protein QXP84_03675 [Candidatus Korarchaeum sp.]
MRFFHILRFHHWARSRVSPHAESSVELPLSSSASDVTPMRVK